MVNIKILINMLLLKYPKNPKWMNLIRGRTHIVMLLLVSIYHIILILICFIQNQCWKILLMFFSFVQWTSSLFFIDLFHNPFRGRKRIVWYLVILPLFISWCGVLLPVAALICNWPSPLPLHCPLRYLSWEHPHYPKVSW